jgi:hypothetical protein
MEDTPASVIEHLTRGTRCSERSPLRAHRRLVTAAAASACALAVTAITSIAMNVTDSSDNGRTAQAAEILSVTEVDSPENMDAAIGVEPPLQVREPAPTTPPYSFRRSAPAPRTPLAASQATEQPAPLAPAPAPVAPPTETPAPTPPVATPAPTPIPEPSETPADPGEGEIEPQPDTGQPGQDAPIDAPSSDWSSLLPLLGENAPSIERD